MDNKEIVRKILKAEFGTVSGLKLQDNTNNEVYVATAGKQKVVFKAYKNKGVHKDVEPYVRSRIGTSPFIRKMYFTDATMTKYPDEYIVLEYVEGDNLRTLLEGGKLTARKIDNVAGQVHDFIEFMTAYRMQGCGFVNERGETSHKEWMPFLFDYQTPTMNSLTEKGFDPAICLRAYEVLLKNRAQINTTDFRLLPIDLNLGNLIVTDKGRLVDLDIGGIASGPKLFALGEYMGHTYTTPLCEPVIHRFGLNANQERELHIYALIMNLNVLAFIAKHNFGDPQTVKPWGNHTSFVDLIQKHYEKIK